MDTLMTENEIEAWGQNPSNLTVERFNELFMGVEQTPNMVANMIALKRCYPEWFIRVAEAGHDPDFDKKMEAQVATKEPRFPVGQKLKRRMFKGDIDAVIHGWNGTHYNIFFPHANKAGYWQSEQMVEQQYYISEN